MGPETRLPSIVIGFVTVKVPNSAPSSTLIWPPDCVLVMAPAIVLHAAVREQGFASEPVPDTQVRVAPADGTKTRGLLTGVFAMSRLLGSLTSMLPPVMSRS